MVFSAVHVKVSSVNGYGVTTLNDPTTDKQYVRSVSVTDGVQVQPSGTVTLPLRNPSTNQPHKDLIKPGDLVTIEFLVNSPAKKGWWLALHGPVRSVAERTVITDAGSESVCVLNVGSMLDILAADAVAVWMYLYSVKGIDVTRASLTADETNTRPYEVAFNWLSKIAFDGSAYNPAGSLGSYLHLDFGGLDANVAAMYKLAMAEGSHLQIISQLLDSPFHELYATAGTPGEFQGSVTHPATGGGVKEAGAGTILRWRAAPYPFCPLGGGSNTSEWDALPLHKLSPQDVVSERGSEYTLAPERNFFVAYPGYDVFNEMFAYTMAVPVANDSSIRRFGYRPLKSQSSLLINEETSRGDLMQFYEELTWRFAGQWNNFSMFENGTVSVPYAAAWIKSGDRLETLSPWQSNRTYQYHVASRTITWDALQGGRATFNLERGYDTARGPAFHAEGLRRMELGSEAITDGNRDHDTPGV